MFSISVAVATPHTAPTPTFPDVLDITTYNVGGSPSINNYVPMPDEVDTGDLLLMFFSIRRDPLDPVNLTTPSGWTAMDTSYYGYVQAAFYAKDAAGTEGGTTVNVVADAALSACAIVFRITDWLGTLGTDVEFEVNVEDGQTVVHPTLTPTWGTEDTLWIAAVIGGDDRESLLSYPSNYTGFTEEVCNNGGNNSCEIGAAWRKLSTTSQTPASFSYDAGESWVAYTVGVKPSGVSPSGTLFSDATRWGDLTVWVDN